VYHLTCEQRDDADESFLCYLLTLLIHFLMNLFSISIGHTIIRNPPPPSPAPPPMPRADSLLATGGCGPTLDLGTLIPRGYTASGARYYKASSANVYLYFEPDCKGQGNSAARWVLDDTRPSTTAESDLDFNGDCLYLARRIANAVSSTAPLGSQVWRGTCRGANTDFTLTLEEEAVADTSSKPPNPPPPSPSPPSPSPPSPSPPPPLPPPPSPTRDDLCERECGTGTCADVEAYFSCDQLVDINCSCDGCCSDTVNRDFVG